MLLLHRLFNADGVYQQLQVSHDFQLMAACVALDSLFGQQLGEVTMGNHKVEQVRTVALFAGVYDSCTWLISFSASRSARSTRSSCLARPVSNRCTARAA